MFRSILLGLLLAGLPALARAQVPAGPLSAPFLDGPHSTREGDISARHIYGDTGSSTVAGSPLAAMVPFPTRPMVNGAGTEVSEPQSGYGQTASICRSCESTSDWCSLCTLLTNLVRFDVGVLASRQSREAIGVSAALALNRHRPQRLLRP